MRVMADMHACPANAHFGCAGVVAGIVVSRSLCISATPGWLQQQCVNCPWLLTQHQTMMHACCCLKLAALLLLMLGTELLLLLCLCCWQC